MKKHIPNIITGLNLCLGSIALVVAFYDLMFASYLILIAAVLDFLDGFFARILNAKSNFGQQFDSFADLVSFGIAPSVIMFLLLLQSSNLPPLTIQKIHVFPFISMIIPLCAAIRLVRFNLNNKMSNFTGLPTPAAAIFLVSLPLMQVQVNDGSSIAPIIINTYFLATSIVFISFLMISTFPMISLKMDIKTLAKNPYILSIIAGGILMFVFFGLGGLAPIILLYIILSLTSNLLGSN